METDHTKLKSLNGAIGEAESKGDRDFFEKHLAPAFAMRRAKPGVYDMRKEFIDKVAESPARTTEIESITLLQQPCIRGVHRDDGRQPVQQPPALHPQRA